MGPLESRTKVFSVSLVEKKKTREVIGKYPEISFSFLLVRQKDKGVSFTKERFDVWSI
jgi:hypothetical protein